MPTPPTTCAFCGKPALAPTEHEETVLVAGARVVGRVPATRCTACGEVTVTADALSRLEHNAVIALVTAGHRSGALFRFARKALALTARDLGAILGVAPETISRWENGERDVDTSTLALVASIVRERMDGRDDTASMLRALHGPLPASREAIRVELR